MPSASRNWMVRGDTATKDGEEVQRHTTIDTMTVLSVSELQP